MYTYVYTDQSVTCIIVTPIIFQSPTPPQYVFWYHNNHMINYDTRGSVSIQTDPGPAQSRLIIHQAVESDTGNYTCSASNTKPASIYVFVTEGMTCKIFIPTCPQLFSLRHSAATATAFFYHKTTNGSTPENEWIDSVW